ncbi:hypothetical protein F5148DRAFT_1162905 [Russula earlei]|uniref:Uncharacterized protein n=1 Tax=Russula earlei TaxID=71964 RepID=A0ACC0UME7_9AGAM|nr:hypothetical protein F5148DRAFT_1162905 [Russula earlei]
MSSTPSSPSSTARSSSPLVEPLPSPELVLVNDTDSPNEELDFSSDEELLDEVAAQPDGLIAPIIPPLSPTLVLLYLSIPYLKLGPMFLPTSDTPLSRSIPTLLICAAFAAWTRELWYLLARYLRKVDLEDVISDAFARGSNRTRTRLSLPVVVRLGTIVMRLLLASVSLRGSHIPPYRFRSWKSSPVVVSVDALIPLIPARSPAIARGLITVVLTFALLPLYAARSLASKRIIYATWASFVAYLIWLGATSYAHIKGTLSADLHWQRPGILWQGITSTAFVFSSSWTLSLYASLRGSMPAITTKRRRRRSFRNLIAVSVAVASALVLPLCVFASSSDEPKTSEQGVIALVSISSATNLILTIPAILLTIPLASSPWAVRRTSPTVSKVIIYSVTVALSVLPRRATVVLGDLLLVLSLLSTYVLPAFLHITVHYFKRPLSIVLPASPTHARDGERDELLQRKERSLQRRRLGRRLVWDAVSWVSVLVLGAGGSAWAIGRVLGRW